MVKGITIIDSDTYEEVLFALKEVKRDLFATRGKDMCEGKINHLIGVNISNIDRILSKLTDKK